MNISTRLTLCTKTIEATYFVSVDTDYPVLSDEYIAELVEESIKKDIKNNTDVFSSTARYTLLLNKLSYFIRQGAKNKNKRSTLYQDKDNIFADIYDMMFFKDDNTSIAIHDIARSMGIDIFGGYDPNSTPDLVLTLDTGRRYRR